MDTYAAQEFFKNLCQTHDCAYSELKRIGKWNRVDRDFINSIYQWEELLEKTQLLIVKTIKTIRKNNLKIVITTKAEVYALIMYYTMITDAEYDILNVDEQFIKLIPDDEICQGFKEAYIEKDVSKMIALYDETYMKDLLRDDDDD